MGVFCMFSILLTFVGLSTQQTILMCLDRWTCSLTDSFMYISWLFRYFISKDISCVLHVQILLRISISHERHKLLLALFMMFWTMHLKITFDILWLTTSKNDLVILCTNILSVNIVGFRLSSKPMFPRRFTISRQLSKYMLNFTLSVLLAMIISHDFDFISCNWHAITGFGYFVFSWDGERHQTTKWRTPPNHHQALAP